MQFFYIALSLVFASGFYYIGNITSSYFKFNILINKISNPIYQYTLLGITFFIFIFYPIFFLGIFKLIHFKILSYLVLIFGAINIFLNYDKIIFFIKKNFFIKRNFYDFLVLSLLTLYFLLSLTPATSEDSVSYHLDTSKHILKYGYFSKDLFIPEAPLVGAGEFLNAFALSINIIQFTSLINFIGIISIIGIVKRFSERNFCTKNNQNFIILCVLSYPILVFFVPSSKPQLFPISLIFFSYATLIYCLNFLENKSLLNKASYFLIVLPIVAVQTKISFSLSFFIIVTTFFLILRSKINLKNFIFIFIVLCAFGLLPHPLWKQSVYDYPFYYFFINPYPMNIPAMDLAYAQLRLYYSETFPYLLLFPLQLGDLTQFIGLGLFTLFFLFKYNFKNKKIYIFIILFYFTVFSFFGQKTPRFYTEIYFFMILILTFIIKDFHTGKLFKIIKVGMISQALFVITISLFGVYNLFPGNFSNDLKHKVQSKHAIGYNLYRWANSVLPDNSVTIINHRSTYFAEKNFIYFGMSGFLDNSNKEYHLKKLKKKKPDYILFFGDKEVFSYNRLDFKDCISGIYKKKINVGFNETRNPFNTGSYYNAYIYNFDSNKLNDCVKSD